MYYLLRIFTREIALKTKNISGLRFLPSDLSSSKTNFKSECHRFFKKTLNFAFVSLICSKSFLTFTRITAFQIREFSSLTVRPFYIFVITYIEIDKMKMCKSRFKNSEKKSKVCYRRVAGKFKWLENRT